MTNDNILSTSKFLCVFNSTKQTFDVNL